MHDRPSPPNVQTVLPQWGGPDASPPSDHERGRPSAALPSSPDSPLPMVKPVQSTDQHSGHGHHSDDGQPVAYDGYLKPLLSEDGEVILEVLPL